MAFGFGPGNEMQRSFKSNRKLQGKKKSLKELREETGPTTLKDGELKFKEPTPEEMEAFRIKLAAQKKKERVKGLIVFGVLAVIGAILVYLITGVPI